MPNKQEELLRCDYDFLYTLTKEVNLAYRNYNYPSKSYLINLLSSKFDSKAIKEIVDLYMLCFDAEYVANMVKPDSVGKITNSIKEFFEQNQVIYEVPLGKRTCDIIIIKNNEINAIEIKSARDKIVSAIEQLKYYQLWSNKVYLVYDEVHKNNINRYKNTDFGLLEYSHGIIREIQVPKYNSLQKEVILNFMSYSFIRKMMSYYRLKRVNGKKEMVKELNKKISNESIQNLFINYLNSK
jgi:hypothetical protein